MRIIERGSGTPLVVVPGVQGRWEYFTPTVEALGRSFHVLTFSLCGELGCPPIDRSRGIDSFTDQIAAALDARGLERAIICGISFGGVAALRFAAEHPERTAALVLVSTPGPGWHLKKRHQLYVRRPWLFAPAFLARSRRAGAICLMAGEDDPARAGHARPDGQTRRADWHRRLRD
jgi:pimeloyl-ACP methyl ester carboxylesterase